MAPTVGTVRAGRVCVSVINVCGSRAKLPKGTWVPLSRDMELLEMGGALDTTAVTQRLAATKGGGANAIDGEDFWRDERRRACAV